jgi:hypothetical protein
MWDKLLTPEERAILVHLHGAVEQFRRKPQLRLRFSDYQEFVMSLEEAIDGLLKKLPPEERVKGLSAQERVKGLSTHERMKGIPPEERLEGLSAEERKRLLALLSS